MDSAAIAPLNFGPIASGRVPLTTWGFAVLLGAVLLGAVSLAVPSRRSSSLFEQKVVTDGSGMLTVHELVARAAAVITQHGDDGHASQTIATALLKEDSAGAFDGVESSKILAAVLTGKLRAISHGENYRIVYVASPPDSARLHNEAYYRISAHLVVALPAPAGLDSSH